MSKWVITMGYAAFFLALNWPVLVLVNRLEPRIGPFPLFVFWLLLWSLGGAIFHLIVALHVWGDPQVPERGP
ncbi:MAG TPA: hypothetical protein EYP85_15060 [Armatimonadetes bacterium]|nr:hypothetical protein [Armatimonadota bacterium]